MNDLERLRAIAPEGPAIITSTVALIEEGMAKTRLNQLHGYWDHLSYPHPNTPSLHVVEQPLSGTRQKVVQAGLELPDVVSISPGLFFRASTDQVPSARSVIPYVRSTVPPLANAPQGPGIDYVVNNWFRGKFVPAVVMNGDELPADRPYILPGDINFISRPACGTTQFNTIPLFEDWELGNGALHKDVLRRLTIFHAIIKRLIIGPAAGIGTDELAQTIVDPPALGHQPPADLFGDSGKLSKSRTYRC